MSDVLVETPEAAPRTRLITLNRPEARNALTRTVIRGITAALEEASRDRAVRCVVLTGAGGHFCAGADLRRNLMDDPDMMQNLESYMDEYHALIGAIVKSRVPTIAMMDGAAVGFGADMALACDLRVASKAAYLQEKFVKIGLMPDGGGSFWLPRLVGTARALQWILLAEKLEASRLHELGVVYKVVAPEELSGSALTLAHEIEAGPPLAFEAIRRAVYGSWGDVAAALRREREEQLKLLRTNDVIEGIMAWSQKREPDFQGH